MSFLKQTIAEGLIAIESKIMIHHHMERLLTNIIYEEIYLGKEVSFLAPQKNLLTTALEKEFKNQVVFLYSNLDQVLFNYLQYKDEIKENTFLFFDLLKNNIQPNPYKENLLLSLKKTMEIKDRLVFFEEDLYNFSHLFDYYARLKNLNQETINVDSVFNVTGDNKNFYYPLNHKHYGPYQSNHICEFIDNGFGKEMWCKNEGCQKTIYLK